MAANLPVVDTTVAGVNPATSRTTAVTTGGGLAFENDGNVILEVEATGALVVTVVTPGSVEGQAVGDVTSGSLAAGQRRIMGPFNPANFNHSSAAADATLAGKTQVTFDTTAGSVKAYRVRDF